jgi:hypothetical protein
LLHLNRFEVGEKGRRRYLVKCKERVQRYNCARINSQMGGQGMWACTSGLSKGLAHVGDDRSFPARAPQDWSLGRCDACDRWRAALQMETPNPSFILSTSMEAATRQSNSPSCARSHKASATPLSPSPVPSRWFHGPRFHPSSSPSPSLPAAATSFLLRALKTTYPASLPSRPRCQLMS